MAGQSFSKIIRMVSAMVVAGSLAACATTSEPSHGPTTPPVTPKPGPATIALNPVAFAALPGWSAADLTLAFDAFKRSCAAVLKRPADVKLGASARYGGLVGDWQPVCNAAIATDRAEARTFFEANFQPYQVQSEGGVAKLTGYYEPVFEGRKTPEAGFDEPIMSKPTSMLKIDLSEFVKATEMDPATAPKGTWWGLVQGDKVVPFPARGNLSGTGSEPLAYAHPADVYDLQVQGSGRVVFPDGTQLRAAWNGNNGRKWNSIFATLKTRNLVTPAELTKPGVRAWMDRTDRAVVREVMNTDPSYVFFKLDPILDPTGGPNGAQGVPLTGLGSVAIDPSYHPYGAVLYVDSVAPAPGGSATPLQRMLIAQDTGGAIRRGPLRGDVYFGTGNEAGALAGKMNAASPQFFTLLPKSAPNAAIVTPVAP